MSEYFPDEIPPRTYNHTEFFVLSFPKMYYTRKHTNNTKSKDVTIRDIPQPKKRKSTETPMNFHSDIRHAFIRTREGFSDGEQAHPWPRKISKGTINRRENGENKKARMYPCTQKEDPHIADLFAYVIHLRHNVHTTFQLSFAVTTLINRPCYVTHLTAVFAQAELRSEKYLTRIVGDVSEKYIFGKSDAKIK